MAMDFEKERALRLLGSLSDGRLLAAAAVLGAYWVSAGLGCR